MTRFDQPHAPSLRYRLVGKIVESDEAHGWTAPAVDWLGTTDLTADELAAGPSNRGPRPTRRSSPPGGTGATGHVVGRTGSPAGPSSLF